MAATNLIAKLRSIDCTHNEKRTGEWLRVRAIAFEIGLFCSLTSEIRGAALLQRHATEGSELEHRVSHDAV